MEQAENEFLSKAAEFFDGAAVVCVGHPVGHNDQTRYITRGAGSYYAVDALLDLWTSGQVPPGSWYMSPNGVVAVGESEQDPGGPLPWNDVLAKELWKHVRVFHRRVKDVSAGALVLATAGQGFSNGATRVLCASFGNTLACKSAAELWLANRRNME